MQRILTALLGLQFVVSALSLGGGWLAFSECAGFCDTKLGMLCCRSTGFTDYRCQAGVVECWAPSAY